MKNKRIRQYVGVLCALIGYYIIHEGAHLVCALSQGVFKKINLMALGVQVDIYRDRLTDTGLGWFCLVGPLATWVVGWLLVLLSKRICRWKSQLLKACAWYTSIVMLILDPLYISVLYRLVGGGDMNGIKLLMPELLAAALFALLAIVNIALLIKVLYPRYTASFQQRSE